MSEAWQTGSAVIRDATGLHARPAVKLTKLAKRFEARVEIRREAGETWINAKSPSAVMKLKAPHLARLEIRASGDDAPAAVAALRDLIDRDFDDSTEG
ncbi:HPr family phosphocarrier protein [Rhodobium gokarnense]|uniref:Phosphocarrier protein HPr n=1 Tax=Rhodobium gokarnense TaxID=364296 RepID=A0ABT3HG73_9HYPH|nr:HPr family phosphocarrier protein [Rhodobium gokarnense]MCW2309271.1 phosphocarrier protein [Rhodobium gokarnense]